MAFVDPQSIAIDGSTVTLARVPSSKVESIGKFSGNDGNTVITVHQNSTNNRLRHEYRLTLRKIATDPFTAQNKEVSASVILAIDEPKVGFTDEELIGAFASVSAELTEESNVQLTRLLNGEL